MSTSRSSAPDAGRRAVAHRQRAGDARIGQPILQEQELAVERGVDGPRPAADIDLEAALEVVRPAAAIEMVVRRVHHDVVQLLARLREVGGLAERDAREDDARARLARRKPILHGIAVGQRATGW